MNYYVSESWSFDPNQRVLKRHGQAPVKLPPKPARLLELLCNSAEELLPSYQIIEEIWDGNIAVGEQGIRQAVLRLRREIPDGDTDQPAVINVPRKGYKLRDTVNRSSLKTPKRSLSRNFAVAMSIVAAGILTAFLWVLQNDEPAVSLVPAVPVTLASGFEESPKLMPGDGSLIYSADHSGDFEIYQKNLLEADAADHLILQKPGNQGGMAWSPDGTRFAFLSTTEDTRSDDVYVYDRTTGQETFIAKQFAPKFSRSPYGLAWSPVEDVIAYTSMTGSGTGFAIFLHDLDRQESVQLTQPDYIDMHPAFSPDGKTVSFLRISNPELSMLFSIDIERGEERSVFEDNLKIYGHLWLDPSRILASVWEQGFFYPYVFDVDRKVRTRVPLAGNFKFPSASSQDIFYVRSLIERQINVYRLDSGRLVAEDTIAGIGNQRAPVVNPATGRIVFVSDRSGQNELWMRDRYDAESVHLPVGIPGPDFVSISESGSLLVFRYKNEQTSQTELALFDLDQQTVHTLPVQNPLEGLFVGDDRYLAYMVFEQGSRQLWLLDLETDHQRLIAQDVWAPLGADQSSNTLYFSKQGEVIAYNLEDDTQRTLAIEASMNGHVAIADGHMYLFRRSGNDARLIQHDLDTAEERVLGQVSADLIDHLSFMAVNPQTQRVYVTVIGKNESDIYKMARKDVRTASRDL